MAAAASVASGTTPAATTPTTSDVQSVRLPVTERSAMCLWKRLGWQRSAVQIDASPYSWVTFDVPSQWIVRTENKNGFMETTLQVPDRSASISVSYAPWCGTDVQGIRAMLRTLPAISQPHRTSLLYSLRSNTAALGYFCNFCETYEDFAYTQPNAVIGWWTWEKQYLICPGCVTSNASKIMKTSHADFSATWNDPMQRAQWIFLYRPLATRRDLPVARCFFELSDPVDYSLWKDDERNKQRQSHYFCTADDESKEFAQVAAASVLLSNNASGAK